MSSKYEPQTKIYYGTLNNANHRLVPAPNINISLEYNYSNDTIIGYSYIINLNGYASALDLRDLEYGDTIPENINQNFGAVTDSINKIRSILTNNGSVLHIVDKDNNSILKAKGGILRSFSFDESNNNWRQFANYTASIEFNSLDLGDSVENCENIFLDSTTYNNDGILDISKYKIKSFNDSWSFTFDENDSFSKIKFTDVGTNININNHGFNIEYSINAVGKHFFDYSNENNSTSTLLPAYEQAKNFVQYRLHSQVTNLISNVLKDSYSTSCISSDGLNDILQPGSSGLLKGLSNYKIFNEKISCDSSEAEGSFSATYSAVVKNSSGNSFFSSPETRHSVTKSINTVNNNGISSKNISVNGTIEGLIEGGLIRTPGPIRLPSTGSILISNNSSTSKYDNAKSLLDKIYNESDYSAGIGQSGKRDLKMSFKNSLGITLAQLNTQASPLDTIPDPPHPTTFNLTHDYNAGTINYSIEYGNKTCGRKFHDISIQTSNPNKVLATFNIPNSYNCPTIQELGTYTAKTVNLTIQGVDFTETGQPTELDIVQELINKHLSLDCFDNGYLPEYTLPPDGNYIITQKQYTTNPIDGSFTVNISYICDTIGCSLTSLCGG